VDRGQQKLPLPRSQLEGRIAGPRAVLLKGARGEWAGGVAGPSVPGWPLGEDPWSRHQLPSLTVWNVTSAQHPPTLGPDSPLGAMPAGN
jgi:hypothetical protein